jgi:hypothetical protein
MNWYESAYHHRKFSSVIHSRNKPFPAPGVHEITIGAAFPGSSDGHSECLPLMSSELAICLISLSWHRRLDRVWKALANCSIGVASRNFDDVQAGVGR